jgi:hypothetical protein
MALNFGVLDQGGPSNFFEGYSQGQEKMQANAMAQQKAAQAQQEFGMRQQEFAAGQADKQRVAKAAMVTQRTAAARDALLRAPNPEAARAIVRAQHADPYLGPIRSQFGSLEADLAEVPDEPTAFQDYLRKEAMGADKFIESQASEQGFQNLLARVKGSPSGVAAAGMNMPAGPQPSGAVTSPVRTNQMMPNQNQVNAMVAPAIGGRTPQEIAREIDTLSESSDPRAKAMVARLSKEYEASLKVANPTMSDRFVPVGRLVFDRQTQQYISPSQAQLAQSQERPSTAGVGGKPPIGYRFTPAGDLEPIPGGPAARATEPKPLTAVQETKRRDTLGKEFKSATSALQTTQDVLDSILFVKSEPGLSRATGFSGQLPSFPEGAAASADVRLANLKGKVTALGKAAAAASGAIGSIATVEWKILADQIANIDPVKGTGPLLNQLDLVELQAKGAMERIQDAYQRQFGEDFERFPQFSNLPPPKSAIKAKTPAAAAAPQGTGGFKYLGKESK